jgi:hypothetical protein
MQTTLKPPAPIGSGKPPLIRTHSSETRMMHAMAMVDRSDEAATAAAESSSHLPAPVPQPTFLTRPSSFHSLASSPASASPSSFGSSTSLSSSGGESADSGGAATGTQTPSHPPQAHQTESGGTAGVSRGSVHIVWSIADVPFPSSLPPAYAIDRVQRIAESYGSIATFKVISPSETNDRGGHGGGSSTLSMSLKKCLHDHGIELEEVYRQAHTSSLDLAVLTNILRISIGEVEQQVQSQYQHRGGNASVGRGSTLILLANQEEFSRALHVLRRSNRFIDVVVIYHHATQPTGNALLPMQAHEPISLIRHATVSFEWSQLLRHGLPSSQAILFDQPRPIAPHPTGGHAHDRREHMRSTSLKDLPSLVQSHHHGSSGSYSLASSGSSGYNSRSSTPLSSRSSSALLPSNFSFASTTNSRSSSISSHPSIDSQASSSSSSGRSMMGAVLDVTPAFDSNSTNLGELSVELVLERLQPKVRAMVLAFKSVLAYCETERIIPRSDGRFARITHVFMRANRYSSVCYHCGCVCLCVVNPSSRSVCSILLSASAHSWLMSILSNCSHSPSVAVSQPWRVGRLSGSSIRRRVVMAVMGHPCASLNVPTSFSRRNG